MTTVSLRRLLLACTCALSISCPRNPATGARQLNFVSQEKEIELGKQGAEEVRSSMGLYDNEALQRYVSDIGMRLAKASERPNLPWSFHVVDDSTVNAFALPGGPIFVTRGLLAHMENEAQLAIVLGHEVGHVTAEHSVNQLSKQQIAQVGLGLGAMFSQQLASLGMGGMQLLFLKFGRDDERQSDSLALRYAGKAGYDVRAAPDVFEVLRRVGESGGRGGGKVPNWLATHPDPEERVANMRAKLAKMAPQEFANARLDEPRLMQALDGLTYGDDPREGIVRGTRFCHPGMRFCVDFPQGFQVQNTKSQVVAQPEHGSAGMALSLGPNLPEEAALSQFFEKSGARQAGAPTRMGQATAAPFQAETEQGVVGGWIAFMRRGDTPLQFMLLSSIEGARAHEGGFHRLVTSMAPLEDPALLNAKPARIRVEKLPAQTTLRALQQQHPGASIEELARINQRDVDATLPAGELVKWIAPG